VLDPKTIRQDPERLKEIVRLRKVDPARADVDRWLTLDARRREIQLAIDELNARKKQIASIGKKDPDAAREQGQALREELRGKEEALAGVTRDWDALMEWFPNWIARDMPQGKGDQDNVEEAAWIPGRGYLEPASLGRGSEGSARHMPRAPLGADGQQFEPLHYSDLGERLGGIDTAQGGKVSGSRFAYILGDIALLQIGIQRLLTDELIRREYSPIIPPLLVRERSLYGTSHFPEQRDQVYEIRTDNVEEPLPLFLVGSSEPTNFSYFMDRVLEVDTLPQRIFAATPCFRSEAGSWGKDVRGIKRVHQFDKIEMNAVCTEAQSGAIYEEFREINEWLLQQIGLPYRIVDKCTGDAGYLATFRQRDLEVWMSGLGEFMELMTDTHTSEYQARRLNIRYRAPEGGLRFCHTVNDTGCAMGRMLIAILDNYQTADGSVRVPEVLRPAVGKELLVPPS
jgi:seryl-tRNA synthetase